MTVSTSDVAVVLTALVAFLFYTVTRSTSKAAAPVQVRDTNNVLNGAVTDAARERYIFQEKDEAAVRAKLEAGAVKVSKLMVYPIKSCRGTSMSEAKYSPTGLENDRKWCIIDPNNNKIITARAIPKMVLVTPTILQDGDDPCGGRLEVSFPADSGCESFSVPLRPTPDMLDKWKRIEDLSVHSFIDIDGCITEPHPSLVGADRDLCSRTLSKFLGRTVHLVYKGPRPRPSPPAWSDPAMTANVYYHDAWPLLVVSSESLEAVKSLVKEWCQKRSDDDDFRKWDADSIVIERFRPNIIFTGAGRPFPEDRWKEIDITATNASETGSFTLVSKCTRCMLPNIDPSTGIRNPAIPSKPLQVFRIGVDPSNMGDSCFGCNAVAAGYGTLRVGDVISVKAWGVV